MSMPMALMSSSTFSQCTPCPVPIISKCWRCSKVALDNRHDHACMCRSDAVRRHYAGNLLRVYWLLLPMAAIR